MSARTEAKGKQSIEARNLEIMLERTLARDRADEKDSHWSCAEFSMGGRKILRAADERYLEIGVPLLYSKQRRMQPPVICLW